MLVGFDCRYPGAIIAAALVGILANAALGSCWLGPITGPGTGALTVRKGAARRGPGALRRLRPNWADAKTKRAGGRNLARRS
jgi:hypothetical protein